MKIARIKMKTSEPDQFYDFIYFGFFCPFFIPIFRFFVYDTKINLVVHC